MTIEVMVEDKGRDHNFSSIHLQKHTNILRKTLEKIKTYPQKVIPQISY